MNIFYAPNIIADFFELSDEESKHCTRVLRLAENDKVQLVDGKGGMYIASITSTKPRCMLAIESKTEEFEKHPFYLHVAISPLKNTDRFEWFVEKAVELGIDEITPILCHRTERRNVNADRLERIVVSAMKQSVKAYKPLVNSCIDYKKFISQQQLGSIFIAHCADGEKKHINDIYKPGERVTILIGPEGDFTENEINDALNNNFKAVTLGTSRLRTETAGVKACTVFNFLNKV
jgi:16S rRNA (uracil1498-N3)-methyltransferase